MQSTKVISIVGCGGKSTLLKHLAIKYKNEHKKVLITTSTKMLISQLQFADFINTNNYTNQGIYAVYNKLDDIKCQGIDYKQLTTIYHNFDIVLIEADGCACKLGKLANRETEPVVRDITTETIGIINFKILNQKVTTDNTFNYHLTNEKEYNIDIIYNYILNKKGLFKNSIGEKTVCIITDNYNFLKVDDLLYKNLKTL